MAYSLNKVQIIGNLTRDPEMRTTPNGAAVTSFSVATNYSYKDSSGQRQDKAEYHNIVAWSRLAEIVHQYTRKGTKLYIEGRLQTREWEGQDGVKRYRTEIIASELIILDSKGQSSGNSGADFSRDHQTIAKEPSNSAPIEVGEEVSIDDLPF